MEPTESEKGPISASIIVGIIGKRALQGKDEAVRRAIAVIFDEIDQRYPMTRKILLTALAEGADRIAAGEAGLREQWTTVAILPLEPDLYCQDFDKKESVSAFQAYLAAPRTRVVTLPSLMEESGSAPYEASELQRRPGVPNPARTLHYEQAGLYIANAATVLIAVMPGTEQPNRIGGTARIAHYRACGRLDEIANDVAMRSRVLPHATPLELVRPGSFWLVDLGAISDAEQSLAGPWFKICDGASKNTERLRDRTKHSLRLADRIDRFNRRVLKATGADTAAKANDAAEYLRHVRSLVSRIQSGSVKKTRMAAVALAGLFFFAVASWEVFVERDHMLSGFAGHAEDGVVLYVLFILAAIVLHFFARWRLWQSIAEDYRAVAESLRVQVAWWEFGLYGSKYRVDNYYLERATGSLGLVREAVRTMINSALLMADPPKPVAGAELMWIDGQIRFFCERIKQRVPALDRVELGSWSFFLSSIGAAVFLLVMSSSPSTFEHFREFHLAAASFALAGGGAIALGLRGAIGPKGLTNLSYEQKRLLQLLVLFCAVVTGMALASGLFCLSGDLNLGIARAGILLIVFVTFAGAIRYVAEKLSWEVELHGYEDALDAFKTGSAELDKIESSTLSDEQKGDHRERVIFQLGRLALAENESWLRAHRERPLEPVY